MSTRTPAIYIAGPMSGYPKFNFPAFFSAAYEYRKRGYRVFNPAARDIERHGVDISEGNSTGDQQQAAQEHGFDLRVALEEDLTWICQEATDMLMLRGWESSKGARAEHALAVALDLKIHYQAN